jgi:hypothetical protein
MRMRLMTRRGHALLTFTPLEGMSDWCRRSCRAGGCRGRLSFDHVGRLPVWRL